MHNCEKHHCAAIRIGSFSGGSCCGTTINCKNGSICCSIFSDLWRKAENKIEWWLFYQLFWPIPKHLNRNIRWHVLLHNIWRDKVIFNTSWKKLIKEKSPTTERREIPLPVWKRRPARRRDWGRTAVFCVNKLCEYGLRPHSRLQSSFSPYRCWFRY